MFGKEFIEHLAEALAPYIARCVRQEIAAAPQVTPRWVDMDGAARLMSTTKEAVRGMARAKLFPVKKMGSRVMFDILDIEKAFSEHTEWLGAN